MDNLTHSLMGVAIAEAIVPRTKKIPRASIILASAVAGNAPDFEVAWTSLILPGKLGYLLFHRGHTHTFLAWPFLTAVIFFTFWGLQKIFFKNAERSNQYWRNLLLVCAIGPLAHIFLDYLGNYGVHPFWPGNNNWIYGDAVFIIDPLVWFTLSSALFAVTESLWLRIAYATHLLLIPVIMVAVPFIPWPVALAQSLLGAAIFVGFLRCRYERVLPALFAILSVFFLSSFGMENFVRGRLLNSTTALDLGEASEVVDIAISPYPANPLCWRAHLVRANEATDIYEVWSGFYSPLSSEDGQKLCQSNLQDSPNVAGELLTDYSGDGVTWERVWHSELSTFRELAQKSCHFYAFLHYARVPAWMLDDNSIYMSDLRYDRDKALGFAEFSEPITNSTKDCPKRLPVWKGPRLNLLQPLN